MGHYGFRDENMQDRRTSMLPMSISTSQTTQKKYSVIGPEHICTGLAFAMLASVIGGICCSLSFLIGEGILEYSHAHQDTDRDLLNAMSKMGMMGGVTTDLVLYGVILIYAGYLDPKRHKASTRNIICSSLELVGFPETPVGVGFLEGCCCPVLGLMAFYALNTILSSATGYWLYTRHYKKNIDMQISIEAAAVGIAVTTIPLCFSNIFLLTAYSNFKISYTPPPRALSYPDYAPVFKKKTDLEVALAERDEARNERDAERQKVSSLIRGGIL